jgi:hypothetical protein
MKSFDWYDSISGAYTQTPATITKHTRKLVGSSRENYYFRRLRLYATSNATKASIQNTEPQAVA